MGNPQEIASVVLMLASNSYMTNKVSFFTSPSECNDLCLDYRRRWGYGTLRLLNSDDMRTMDFDMSLGFRIKVDLHMYIKSQIMLPARSSAMLVKLCNIASVVSRDHG